MLSTNLFDVVPNIEAKKTFSYLEYLLCSFTKVVRPKKMELFAKNKVRDGFVCERSRNPRFLPEICIFGKRAAF